MIRHLIAAQNQQAIELLAPWQRARMEIPAFHEEAVRTALQSRGGLPMAAFYHQPHCTASCGCLSNTCTGVDGF
jgi:hypothetical protein